MLEATIHLTLQTHLVQTQVPKHGLLIKNPVAHTVQTMVNM